MTLSFFVPGLPKGAGSKRGFAIRKGAKRVNGKLVGGQYTGAVAMVDTSGEAGKEWRGAIHSVAFEAMRAQRCAVFNEPVVLTAEFIMPRPKSHFRTGRNSGELRGDAPVVHFIAPDTTKLLRQLEDSLTNVVWTDDALVVEQHAWKKYGEQPGARVTIESLPSTGQGTPLLNFGPQNKGFTKRRESAIVAQN